MFTARELKKIFQKEKLFKADEFKALLVQAEKEGEKAEDFLIEKKIISLQSLYGAAARYYQVPLVDLKEQKIKPETLLKIPETFAIKHNLIVFSEDEEGLNIATLHPNKLDIFENISKQFGKKIKVYLTLPEDLKKALDQYHKSFKTEFEYLSQHSDSKYFSAIEEKKDLSEQGLKKMAEDLPVVQILDSLLREAISSGASDIHIEPEENNVLVRFRLDGVLEEAMTLPQTIQSGIIARIKILANLKVDEHRLPQDGRFKIATDRYQVAFRVSIVPIYGGEKVVMRLLPEKEQAKSLEQLGFQDQALKTLKRNISKPHGMILVTGPTGSGKTTTLYTILNILNKPEVNISTIEDPIEYRMARTNQSQVNPKIGYTFASGLRAFMRQDPDIIMVGEIRDLETAEVAVNAAMTGHLLLSTLHTNDAISAIPRLVNIGVPAFLAAFTTNIIVAQRLVRKICPNCIQSYKITPEVALEMEKQFNTKEILASLKKEKAVIKGARSLNSLLFYQGKGCAKCKNTGYKGRIGIYEIFEITPEISELILKQASYQELLNFSRKQGMLTMVEDGFIKAKNGITSLEEIMRVTKE